MRAVWTGRVPSRLPCVTCAHMPELAYTTVMSTLRRLADKGLLAGRPALLALVGGLRSRA